MNQNNIQNNDENKKRLKEILQILMNNDATKTLTPEKLCAVFTELGPFFIKLGQIMSLRQDILPKDYRDALSRLDDNAVGMDYNTLQKIIENEYGVSIDGIFSEFDETPIEVSSINQSHKAVLKEGSTVILKIQRPEVHSVVSRDVALLRKALSVLRLETANKGCVDLGTVLDELWEISQKELNYLIESQNSKRFYELNSDNPLLLIPRINEKYSTSNILAIEYIDSIKITDTEKLVSMGYDLNEIARALSANYVNQFLKDGFFHAAPNDKNISIKNGKIVWSNFALMGSFSEKDLEELNNVVSAIKDLDVVSLKNAILNIAVLNQEVNNSKLYFSLEELLNKYKAMDIREVTVVSIVKDAMVLLNENALSLPESFSLLFIGLINLENILNKIAPKFNMISLFCDSYPEEQEESNDEEVTDEESGKKITEIDDVPEEFLPPKEEKDDLKDNNSASDKKDEKETSSPNKNIIQVQPSILHSSESSTEEQTVDMVAQISDILKLAVDGKTKFNMNLTVSDESLSSIEKIINKLILCLVSVSFLIGACSIITTNIEPKIFGVPILGIALFIISFVLLLWLLIRILKKK